jgi:maleamate amidohydrolase
MELSEPFAQTRALYERKGFGRGRVGFGHHPALLVVDLARAWTDPASPLGSNLDSVLERTMSLLEVARRRRVPVTFTVTAYEASFNDVPPIMLQKLPHRRVLVVGSEWVALHPGLARRETEPLIVKKHTSCFADTPLMSQLASRGTDTLIVTGCSTSGCIRATVEDSFRFGLRTIVPAEAVGDRSRQAHEANLFDIDARYADVVPCDEVLAYLAGVNGIA